MPKTKKKRRGADVVQRATITLTREEAIAMVSGIGAAIRHADVPEAVQGPLHDALTKFDGAFNFFGEERD